MMRLSRTILEKDGVAPYFLGTVAVLGMLKPPFEIIVRSRVMKVKRHPVPTDLLVYTEKEWQLLGQQGRFSHTVMAETVWVYTRESK
jgi:hypothetical protein